MFGATKLFHSQVEPVWQWLQRALADTQNIEAKPPMKALTYRRRVAIGGAGLADNRAILQQKRDALATCNVS